MIQSVPPQQEDISELDRVTIKLKQTQEYLTQYKDSVKKLNRRNTLAVMKLQQLVMDIHKIHPDVITLMEPVELELKKILNFQAPYEV
jgi:hypothetical protein